MRHASINIYDKLILARPINAVIASFLITLFFGLYIPDFKLDASADSLVLENDQALKFYRSIKARYGSDDFLIITYSPQRDLLSDESLADIRQLRDAINKIELVESVVTILDVPLTQSPPVSLNELSDGIRTLETPGVDRELARKEFQSSPLYSNMLVSPDGGTCAIQINFKRDQTFFGLLNERNSLREKQLSSPLTTEEKQQLARVSREFKAYSHVLQDQEKALINDVRSLMDQYRDNATLHLGGVPMIASDSLDFIHKDMRIFGVGVVIFILLILAIAFRKPLWIILPMLTCLMSALIMVGLLGLLEWRVTVVSSNFVSLMLIINLSLAIHLIVRYRELHSNLYSSDQRELVREVVRSKFAPSFYTAITTIVAFASLIVSDIRPVIDFGWMMVMGVSVAFVLTFIFFPAVLMFFKPRQADKLEDLTHLIITRIATTVNRYGKSVFSIFVILSVLSVLGIYQLTVENRFIDYYKKETEIYKGMELIDQKLGGTTPMDVIINAPRSFFETAQQAQVTDATTSGQSMGNGPSDELDDELDLELEMELEMEMEMEASASGGITSSSYWFNYTRMPTIAGIHDYLDGLPQTGKVMSVYTSVSLLEQLRDNQDLDNFFLSIIYKRVPEDMKSVLFSPYMHEDGNQLRYSVRIFESDKQLQRNQLIENTHHDIVKKFNLEPDQVVVSGMAVLYNNMLQSLFRSQILTIGVIFLAILAMFALLFRSLKLALVTIVPNVVPAAMMLGLMGLVGIPLDMMTITIAAICIGIAVDDAIHYVHRFKEEFAKDRQYKAAIERCHSSIGRAMYFTSVIITLGFSILALSNFIPIIYFGLLTGFAIMVALLANLTLLPVLLYWFKPLGVETNTAPVN